MRTIRSQAPPATQHDDSSAPLQPDRSHSVFAARCANFVFGARAWPCTPDLRRLDRWRCAPGPGQRYKERGMAKTVLIVEDNELNMKLFHDLLEAHGYSTLGTRNGIEALNLAR